MQTTSKLSQRESYDLFSTWHVGVKDASTLNQSLILDCNWLQEGKVYNTAEAFKEVGLLPHGMWLLFCGRMGEHQTKQQLPLSALAPSNTQLRSLVWWLLPPLYPQSRVSLWLSSISIAFLSEEAESRHNCCLRNLMRQRDLQWDLSRANHLTCGGPNRRSFQSSFANWASNSHVYKSQLPQNTATSGHLTLCIVAFPSFDFWRHKHLLQWEQ